MHDRRSFIKSVGLLSLILPVKHLFSADRENKQTPNIILIVADDLGYDDLGCYWKERGKKGFEKIDTPYIDRLAHEGVRFSDFHVTSSVCSPSRASILTGCYPPRVGLTKVLYPNSKIGLNPSETTVADILKSKKYATACIGKWHLGVVPEFSPLNFGFDYFFGMPYSNDMKPSVLMKNDTIIEQPVQQKELTKDYTDEAINFIEAHHSRPFFIYLSHTLPHIPLKLDSDFKGASDRKKYGDAIVTIDHYTGELYKTLEKCNILNNTLIIFTSDNGPWLLMGKRGGKAYPLRGGKRTVYEGGFRVPCIMHWPDVIPKNTVQPTFVTSMDLLPTLAHVVRAPLPANKIDGKNIYDIITGTSGETPYEVFLYYTGKRLDAVRAGNWKLIFKRKASWNSPYRYVKNKLLKDKQDTIIPPELYNLETDIHEKNNLINNHPDIVKRLTGLAEQARKELGDNRYGIRGEAVRESGKTTKPK
ncbi:MAG: sulfatase [Chitinispirillaceae bacterium]|nr:sulfatase [Chitinispirillaceae bacterium]